MARGGGGGGGFVRELGIRQELVFGISEAHVYLRQRETERGERDRERV